MSRTSKALKRLGVAGVAVATIGAGVPAFFATAASAAGPTTQLTITPSTQTAAAGTCMLYTVTPQAAGGTTASDTPAITIRLEENPNTATQDVDFCDVAKPGTGSPAPGTYTTQASNGNGTATTARYKNGSGNAGLLNQQYIPGTGVTGSGSPSATGCNSGNNPDVASTAPADAFGGGCNANPTGADSRTFTGTNSTAGATVIAGDNGQITFGVVGAEAGGANITAFVDANANDMLDGSEPGVRATATFTGGGANSVTSVDAEPETGSAAAGDVQTITVTLKNSGGATVAGVTPSAEITSGPNAAQPASGTTAAQPAVTVTCTASDNAGVSTCTYTSRSGKLGQDTIVVWVNQTTGTTVTTGLDSGEPSDTVTRNNTPVASAARNVALAPRDSTTPSGTTRAFTATVKDVNGVAVPNVEVTFTETGPGRFVNATSTPTAGTSTFVTATNENGVATATVTSAPSETGTQEITAAITGVGTRAADGTFTRTGGSTSGNTQCGQAAGAGTGATSTTPAGNCSDSTTNTFVTGTPSPTATPSSSASPSNPAGGRGALSTSTPDIQPNIQGILNATGLTSNAVYELMCYSRPSTTYFVARSATVSAGGSTLEFRILPGTNTRCYIRPQGNDALASNSVVINVHTTLSLSAVRTGVRTYVFQGRNLPRRSGQLITLYRIANGQEIRTANLVTDASGIYRVTRTFTGTGTFQFRVRTSQTLTNAPGASNIITVRIF